jgi:hypothetical protein
MVTSGGTFGLPTINDRSEDPAEHTIKILNIMKDENGCSKFVPLFPLRESSSVFLNEDRFRNVLDWDRSTISRFNVMFVCKWLVSENPKYVLDFYQLDTRPVWENLKDLKLEMSGEAGEEKTDFRLPYLHLFIPGSDTVDATISVISGNVDIPNIEQEYLFRCSLDSEESSSSSEEESELGSSISISLLRQILRSFNRR